MKHILVYIADGDTELYYSIVDTVEEAEARLAEAEEANCRVDAYLIFAVTAECHGLSGLDVSVARDKYAIPMKTP